MLFCRIFKNNTWKLQRNIKKYSAFLRRSRGLKMILWLSLAPLLLPLAWSLYPSSLPRRLPNCMSWHRLKAEFLPVYSHVTRFGKQGCFSHLFWASGSREVHGFFFGLFGMEVFSFNTTLRETDCFYGCLRLILPVPSLFFQKIVFFWFILNISISELFWGTHILDMCVCSYPELTLIIENTGELELRSVYLIKDTSG